MSWLNFSIGAFVEDTNHFLSVLIVDDDVDLCFLIKATLRAEFKVHCLHNLQNAKAHLSKCSFHLLLLDNSLPDGKGIDFIPVALKLHPQLKIVFITADLPEQIQPLALAAGADHFLPKPFALDELGKLVKRFLKAAA